MAALCDPTRRAILARLAKGPAAVGELAEPFRISQQAVSKHLAYLAQAKLIRKRKTGRRQLCVLTPDPITEASDWLVRYRRLWTERFDRLDAYLAELKAKETSPHGRHGG